MQALLIFNLLGPDSSYTSTPLEAVSARQTALRILRPRAKGRKARPLARTHRLRVQPAPGRLLDQFASLVSDAAKAITGRSSPVVELSSSCYRLGAVVAIIDRVQYCPIRSGPQG